MTAVEAPAGTNNLPRPASEWFKGQEDALNLLDKRLSRAGSSVAVTQAVIGLGGVGKSELVLQHADTHRDNYDLMWWITADTPDHLAAGLAALTERLVQPLTAAMRRQEAAGWAVAWLQTHRDWLLVLDNVETPADVNWLLGQLGKAGHLVITTRRDVHWQGRVTTLRLDLLHPDAAVELLTAITSQSGPDDRKIASTLAAELGYLPLALEQAASYITQTRITFARYLHKLRQHPGKAHAATAEGGDAERTIARLWSVHLDTLHSRAPEAVKLLHVLAYYAPNDIPRTLTTHLDPDPEGEDAEMIVGLLASYCMITLTPTAISLHRLIQAVLLATDPTPDATRDTALSWLARSLPDGSSNNLSGWPAFRALTPHVDTIAAHYSDGDENETLADVLGQTAFFEGTQGLHHKALTRDLRALTITEKAFGPSHPTTGLRLSNLATTYRDLGRHTEALPLLERALAISMTALGPDDATIGIQLNNLATTYRDLGRHTEALPLQERALAITETRFGPRHPNTGIQLNNLAATYRDLGRHIEALPLLERALEIATSTLGPNHPNTSTQLSNLAATYSDLGRHAEALPLVERALEITTSTFGPNHPNTSTRISNLAATYRDLGRHTEALPLKERALAISETALGPNHPDTSLQLNNLAATYRDLGRHTEALPLLERALAISETALGPSHPDTGIRLNNLATNYSDLGRHTEALPLFKRALAITELALGLDHPTTRTIAASLASLVEILDHLAG